MELWWSQIRGHHAEGGPKAKGGGRRAANTLGSDQDWFILRVENPRMIWVGNLLAKNAGHLPACPRGQVGNLPAKFAGHLPTQIIRVISGFCVVT